ncbi:hypothetical protein [Streptomyces sp. NPDC007172]|uniref:hypothetical protein n=1 Tax=Streptomyces sp. NPDC007172 TaxID=3364776 RepID=UPI0036A0853A
MPNLDNAPHPPLPSSDAAVVRLTQAMEHRNIRATVTTDGPKVIIQLANLIDAVHFLPEPAVCPPDLLRDVQRALADRQVNATLRTVETRPTEDMPRLEIRLASHHDAIGLSTYLYDART